MSNFHAPVAGSSSSDPIYPSPASSTSTGRKRTRSEKINYPKKRVSVACEVCRSRKTRCDAVKPSCGFCADIGAECVYRKFEDEPRAIERSGRASPANSAFDEHEVIARLKRIESLLATSNRPAEDFTYDELRSPEVLESVGIIPDRTHTSLLIVKPSYYTHPPMTVGINLSGLSQLIRRPAPPALSPLRLDDFEEQLDLQFQAGEELYKKGPVDLDSLNLTSRRLWQLQQTFSRDVLPWCPIIDQQAVAEIVSRTVENSFNPYNIETSLTFFILALGAFAQGSHYMEDEPDNFPGIDYFRAGRQLVEADGFSGNTITYVQCHIFMALYLLYSLRPIQAFEIIRRASSKVLMILQLRSRLAADSTLRELCSRAFWACYLIEHELQSYVPYSALLLQCSQDDVPLPTSDYEEPGIYWFLSEIAIRRIFTRPRHGVGWNMHILYEPNIADEITSQMAQWQMNLPHPVKWSLEDSMNLRPLLDPQKVFLRAQYYSTSAFLLWQYVVRLLTLPSPAGLTSHLEAGGEQEHNRIRDSAAQCLRYAVIHIFAVESLFQNRHVMLMANFNGLYSIVMMLLCAYDVPELQSIQPPRREEAVLSAWRSLKNLEANRPIRKKVEQVERLMRLNGVNPC